MEFLDQLKQRVESAARELSEAQSDYAKAVQRLNACKAKFDIYKNAYSTEAQSLGRQIALPTPSASAASATAAPSTRAMPASPAVLTPAAANGNGDMNVTEFIRELIGHSGNGITAVDIWNKVHERRPEVARNYIYAVLSRLVSRDFATLREHRYFPVVNR